MYIRTLTKSVKEVTKMTLSFLVQSDLLVTQGTADVSHLHVKCKLNDGNLRSC